ncbi:hypothetical protein Bpfe_001215, partial [Biomphalaria pfeifferi]
TDNKEETEAIQLNPHNVAESQSPELVEETETIELNPLNLAESQSPEMVEETETIQLNPLNLDKSQSPELETQSLDDVEEVTDYQNLMSVLNGSDKERILKEKNF